MLASICQPLTVGLAVSGRLINSWNSTACSERWLRFFERSSKNHLQNRGPLMEDRPFL
jgi:hypothetical protein